MRLFKRYMLPVVCVIFCLLRLSAQPSHIHSESYGSSYSIDSIGILDTGTESPGRINVYSSKESYNLLNRNVYYYSKKEFAKKIIDLQGYRNAADFIFQHATMLISFDTVSIEITKCYIKNLKQTGRRFNDLIIKACIIDTFVSNNMYVYRYFILYDKSCKYIELKSNEYYNTFQLAVDNRTLSYVDISGSKFHDYVDINLTVLPDTFLMSNLDLIELKGEIYLTKSSEVDKVCYISLHNTDVSKIHFDYNNFRLLLTNPSTKKELSIDEVQSLYEAVLNNFETRGQMQSYKQCDLEYREYLRQKSAGLEYIYVSFQKYLNNYGYEKERIILWTIRFLFLFWVINIFFIEKLMFSVYDIENISKQKFWRNPAPYSVPRLISLRMWYSFVYTSAIFFLLSFKIDKIKYQNVIWVIYLMVVYTVGIVCLAYIANYILTR